MKTKFGKTIAGVALLFCAYGAGGCHGDLDIMQDNKLSASNMWKEESDATSATYGLYVYLRSALKSMNDVYLCWGELRNGLWGPGTHNTLNGVDQSQVRTSTMSSVNEYADWSVMYKTVNQANLILKHVPEMGISESVRNFSLGNAYFSRAWCYFWIARIWGDAPLALTGTNPRPATSPARARRRDLRPDRKRPDRSRAVRDRQFGQGRSHARRGADAQGRLCAVDVPRRRRRFVVPHYGRGGH
ncbi:MAG: RagB/SusD family nutrient uptake outer membrane protein [Alistipes sp.]